MYHLPLAVQQQLSSRTSVPWVPSRIFYNLPLEYIHSSCSPRYTPTSLPSRKKMCWPGSQWRNEKRWSKTGLGSKEETWLAKEIILKGSHCHFNRLWLAVQSYSHKSGPERQQNGCASPDLSVPSDARRDSCAWTRPTARYRTAWRDRLRARQLRTSVPVLSLYRRLRKKTSQTEV